VITTRVVVLLRCTHLSIDLIDLKIEWKVISYADGRMNEIKRNKRIRASNNGNGSEIHHRAALPIAKPNRK
jgi:hypothetical protein